MTGSFTPINKEKCDHCGSTAGTEIWDDIEGEFVRCKACKKEPFFT